LAQLNENHLNDQKRAVALWREVLKKLPKDQEALTALERNYRRLGNFPELALVLRQLGDLEKNLERRKDLYFELAGLMEDKLNRKNEAAEAYLDILTDDPQDATALKLLRILFDRANRSGAFSRQAALPSTSS
jgi:golgin subfamily B member 1